MNRGIRARAGIAGLAVVLALSGCAAIESVPRMPGPAITSWVPTQAQESSPATTGNLSPDGFASAERMAVRIRNVGCDALSTGFGLRGRLAHRRDQPARGRRLRDPPGLDL